MKNKIKIIWFILKYGYEKFFFKNFKMYAPSVAGNQEVKGKITIENINFLFPMISLLISKLLFKEKIKYPPVISEIFKRSVFISYISMLLIALFIINKTKFI